MSALLPQFADGAPQPCVVFLALAMAFWSPEHATLAWNTTLHTASSRAPEWDVTTTRLAQIVLVKYLVAGVVNLKGKGIVFRVLSGALWVPVQVPQMQHWRTLALRMDLTGFMSMASTISAKYNVAVTAHLFDSD